jgi:hypothetical protein
MSSHPRMRTVTLVIGVVPSYSGGTVRDSHPLPLDRSGVVSRTLEEKDPSCQERSSDRNELYGVSR